MENKNTMLKTIYDLQNKNFFIPSYQRGYRWEKQQVIELLDDVFEFSNSKNEDNSFYCLQPVIIKKNSDDLWELIDGQQRITTLFIIMSYINSLLPMKEELFVIEYETRPGSQVFLEKIIDCSEKEAKQNIDYFHMYNAYIETKEWFKETARKTNQSLNSIIMTLLPIFTNSVKVIWYEIDSESDPTEVFTRVNMGKIPLTNSELIKALFLNQSNFGEDKELIRIRQIEISNEWDSIEYSLQNNDLWFFLTNDKGNLDNRIDFIFAIMAKEKNKEFNIQISEKELLPFHVFNKWFLEFNKKEDAINFIWNKIKSMFLTFQDWFEDRKLYHSVGFLITINNDYIYPSDTIIELKKLSEIYDKDLFLTKISAKIKYSINFSTTGNYHIEDLDYDNRNERVYIKNLLLLFNIISLDNNKEVKSRFPFQLYKKQNWDIEHIHAVKSQISERDYEKEEWLRTNYTSLNNNSLVYRESEIALEKKDYNSLDELINQVLLEFSEKGTEEEINNISNLTLLDEKTNKSYKNSVFPKKRQQILEKDKSGLFIPQGTKNVFLKYYSDEIDSSILWTEKDREYYLKSIKNTLYQYLPEESEINYEQKD